MKTILLACLVLVGCASAPPQVVNSDPQCDKVAWYARATATARDIGMTVDDYNASAKSSTTFAQHMKGVREQVYTMPSKTPADIYTMFYAQCINRGYQAMLTPLPPPVFTPPAWKNQPSPQTVAIPYNVQPNEQYPHHEYPICYSNDGDCK